MEEVLERENLRKALGQVRRNKGAPGIDGMTVEQLAAHLREHWPEIRQALLHCCYQPVPVRPGRDTEAERRRNASTRYSDGHGIVHCHPTPIRIRLL